VFRAYFLLYLKFLNIYASQDDAHIMMPAVWVDTLEIVDEYTGWTPAEFSSIFEDNYGVEPTFYATGAFAGGLILMDAIERSQSLDPLVVADTIRRGSFPTVYGNVTFNEDNQYDTSLLIVQIPAPSGEYAMVLPTAAPNVTLVYPMPNWLSKDCWQKTQGCSGHGTCNAAGQCECDDRYYGLTGSCENYCSGELDVDSSSQSFCKLLQTFYIGGIAPGDRDDNSEILAVLNISTSLINNKTDGWFDNTTSQTVFVVNYLSTDECSSDAGFEAVDRHVQWASDQKAPYLGGIVGAYCSSAR
jgi:hypothetical protein